MSHFRQASQAAEDAINMMYELGGSPIGFELLEEYHRRHGTPSLLVLTQHHPEVAKESARLIADEVQGKDVISIGSGVGFLELEIAKLAKSVIAIELDPGWSWIFSRYLYEHKPTNLDWIFGNAEHFIGKIHGDVAVIATRSGREKMRIIGEQLSDKVVMMEDFELSRIV